jgi:hypothetical protein
MGLANAPLLSTHALSWERGSCKFQMTHIFKSTWDLHSCNGKKQTQVGREALNGHCLQMLCRA